VKFNVLYIAGVYVAICAVFWGLRKWQQRIFARERAEPRGFPVEQAGREPGTRSLEVPTPDPE
jgi:hypothetical protein